jgi:site-specific DNA-methyltransferase (adenine-specific)
MSYLVSLVTPEGGKVLDPFCGSGSTLVAAYQEGFDSVGIELEKDSFNIAKGRIDSLTPSSKSPR